MKNDLPKSMQDDISMMELDQKRLLTFGQIAEHSSEYTDVKLQSIDAQTVVELDHITESSFADDMTIEPDSIITQSNRAPPYELENTLIQQAQHA